MHRSDPEKKNVEGVPGRRNGNMKKAWRFTMNTTASWGQGVLEDENQKSCKKETREAYRCMQESLKINL